MTLDDFKNLVKKVQYIINNKKHKNNMTIINQEGVKFQFLVTRFVVRKKRYGDTYPGYKKPLPRCITITKDGRIIEIEGIKSIFEELSKNGKLDIVAFKLEELILNEF